MIASGNARSFVSRATQIYDSAVASSALYGPNGVDPDPSRLNSAAREKQQSHGSELSMEKGIFEGLKVLDCASFIAAPAAATVLSDFGADVIKIEPPGSGDPYRNLPNLP